MRHLMPLIVAIAALFATACASTPPDPAILSSAERAIAAAEAAGAGELSPTELRFAQDRLQSARQAMDEREYDEVLLRVEQAEINATLAIEKSRAALERRQVNELQRANDLLREELLSTYGEEFTR